MAANPDIVITENRPESRHEARIDDKLAGVLEYELAEGIITFTHTRVFDDFAGRGVGGALARQAFEELRAGGDRKVVAQCPFIAGWIDKHPDYADLEVKGSRRSDDD